MELYLFQVLDLHLIDIIYIQYIRDRTSDFKYRFTIMQNVNNDNYQAIKNLEII